MTAQCEGMGEVGSARYEPALLPPCPSIRVLSYSNCQEIHSRQQTGLAVWVLTSNITYPSSINIINLSTISTTSTKPTWYPYTLGATLMKQFCKRIIMNTTDLTRRKSLPSDITDQISYIYEMGHGKNLVHMAIIYNVTMPSQPYVMHPLDSGSVLADIMHAWSARNDA